MCEIGIRFSTYEARMTNPNLPPARPSGSDSPPLGGSAVINRRLFTRGDLRALGISASNPTLLNWEAAGTFPKRVVISPAKVAWPADEVIAWIEQKLKERNGKRPS